VRLTVRCQLMRLYLDNDGYELSCPRAHRGFSTSLVRRCPIFFGWWRRKFALQLHVVFWSSSITRLFLGIVPTGLFPRTPSFTKLSFVLGARTPRKDLPGGVTLPWRTQASKEKDNTFLQPRRWDGASSLAAWVVASQSQRRLSMQPIL